MEISVKAMDIFFRHVDPEPFLLKMLEQKRIPNGKELQGQFILKAENTLSGYSKDEQINIFEYVTRLHSEHISTHHAPPLKLLAYFGDSVLTIGPDGPVCRFSETLNWRDAYLRLGQDVLVTGWLAAHSDQHRLPDSFAWPATILTDDVDLNRITTDLAENHLHLYAGASTFSLTWCSVMNEPADALRDAEWMETFLQAHSYRGIANAIWPMQRRVLYAVAIRSLLFQKLEGRSDYVWSDLRKLHCSYHERYSATDCQKETQRLKALFGMQFPRPDGRAVCMDYAFTRDLRRDIHRDFRLLASERYFLYRCFEKCFFGDFDLETQWMFYCYLLLKSQFRSEFIQLNQQTGFYNFHEYDERKYKLWKNKTAYWNEDYRQAINATFHEQNIYSLEARLSPKNTPTEDLRAIFEIDKAKLYYDSGNGAIQHWKPSYHTQNRARNEKYYFVQHFPKRQDAIINAKYITPFYRHEQYRKVIRQQSIALAKVLSNSDYYCERVLGIDACSNEIGCRPEVFSVAFRFLRDFSANIKFYRKQALARKKPFLRVTYHVGEDFLDIADGLRAIDEAIHFLELRRGDRLGHALALGVDPELHYDLKCQEIILSKQDLLDNLVWLLYRSVTLKVTIDPILENKMRSQAQALYNEIYRKEISDTYISLEDYYHSMQLRGDDPRCYKNGVFSPYPSTTDLYDLYLICKFNAKKDIWPSYRKDGNLTRLYWLYHYSNRVKRKGAEKTTQIITQQYIYLIVQMQTAMQGYVESCGLSVECNPSSNVLIGTFKEYQKHPLLRFNHGGLSLPGIDPGMCVSINSDDPCVFDTSLTFEYDIMAATLAQMQDEAGNRLYTDQAIREYLQLLIQMGQRQSFKN